MEQEMGCACVPEKSQHKDESSLNSKQKLNILIKKVKLNLQGQSSFNPYETFNNIRSILLRGSQKFVEESQQIQELISYWLDFDLEDLYNNPDVTSEEKYKLYQVWMLTARVMLKVQEFIKKLQFRKSFDSEAYKGVEKIAEFLYKEELEYSPEQNLLTKKAARFTNDDYEVTNFTAENKQKEKNGEFYINQIYQIAKNQQISFILQLFEFLAKIGIITLQEVKPVFENQFIKSLNRIHKRQQRELFINNYYCQHFGQMNELVKDKNTEELKRIFANVLPNYGFYKNQVKIRNKVMNLQKLHQKYSDYNFLEGAHDYIQWMFPNHYGSAFNSQSKPLTYIQSELFKKDHFARLSLFQSILLFADFMGLKYDFQTKSFKIISKKRLKDVILVNYHNHLRIMRILACLSVTGFRSIALILINFLDEQTEKGRFLEKERSEFEKSWRIYGNINLEKAKQMCFLQKEDFQVSQQLMKLVEQEIKKNKSFYFEKQEEFEQGRVESKLREQEQEDQKEQKKPQLKKQIQEKDEKDILESEEKKDNELKQEKQARKEESNVYKVEVELKTEFNSQTVPIEIEKVQ